MLERRSRAMLLNPGEARRVAGALLGSEGLETEGEREGRLGVGPFGRYRIVRLVGTGGMGEVYEAQQESPARRVAIKVVRPDLLSGEALRRFEHETRILGRLEHPGIAPIYEAGRVETGLGSTPYFAMEFVDGRPLTSFAAEAKLPLRARLELFLKVCDAVEHAHRKGVIHRDLKPANILVDASGRPRVMDFGVARATDSDIRATSMGTEVGRLIGTLPYMSPEQVGGDPDELDTRSDVYSLGVVLYELLGGRLPYELKGEGRGRIPEAVRAIRESEPLPLSSIDRVYRGDLDTVVLKALEKERERRYQGVGELAGDLRRYLADEPIVARRASGWYQVMKFARRQRALASSIVVALVGLSLATVVSLGFAFEANHASESAERSATEARRQSQVSDEVRSLLQRMIIAASPRTLGRAATLVEAVEAAAHDLDQAPPDDALTEAALRHAIGAVLQHLGVFDESERQLRRAHELATRPPLAGTVQEAKISRDLAHTLAELDKLEECEQLWARIVDLQRRLLGDVDRETLNAQAEFGAYLIERGQVSQVARGEEILREVLEKSKDLPPESRPDVAGIRYNLVGALMLRGQFREALPAIREIAAEDLARVGDSHPDYLTSLQLLGVTLLNVGGAAEAEPLFRDLIAKDEVVFGTEHIMTLKDKTSLAGAYFELGRPADAEGLLRDVIPRMKASIGDDHSLVVDTIHLLAIVLLEQGRAEEARSIANDMLANLHGDDQGKRIGRANFQQAMAQSLLRLNRATEAEGYALEAWRTLTELRMRPCRQVTRTLRTLIEVEDQLGNVAQADGYRRELQAADTVLQQGR